MTDTSTAAAALVASARADRLRPVFHFTAPAGWLNDPNGVGQVDGVHHLFYQHNPYAPVHDRIHWGHAVSDDLVRWRDRPIALRPGEGQDAEGCWSGVLVDDGGTPTLIYSGRRDGRELACLATGDADLDRWTALDAPIIPERPEGELIAYRDHCVWREGGSWRQLIGSGIAGEGGCAFLYESDDLRSWRPLGTLVIGTAGEVAIDDPDWTGTMWECVDFFRLTPEGTGAPDAASGEQHALVFSAWHDEMTLHPLIALGSYEGTHFEIERVQRLDLGRRHAYAPQTYADEAGRRILWSWMQEGRSDEAARAAGWSGAMTIPRVLTVDANGVVRQQPAPEVTTLREEALAAPWAGAALDIEVDAEVRPDERLELTVLATPDGAERTVVALERGPEGLVLSLDRGRSSLDESTDRRSLSGPVPEGGEGPTHLRVLVDGSSIEAFCDGIALTARVYPTRPDALGASVSGSASVVAATAWRMEQVEEPERALDVSP